MSNMSKFLTLNVKDAIKGFVVAFFTAALTIIQQALTVGMHMDWKAIASAGLAGGIGYILKQLLTDNQGKLGGVI